MVRWQLSTTAGHLRKLVDMLMLEPPLPNRKLSARLLVALWLPQGAMPSLLTCRSGCALGLLDAVPRGDEGSCSSSVCLQSQPLG